MRKRYGHFLRGVTAGTILIVTFGAVVRHLEVTTVLELLFALSPIMVWSGRDAKKQLHIAREREGIQERAERIWHDALSGELTDHQLASLSCELQADIYDQRKTNAPVFAWVYSKYRDSSEQAMRIGVRQLVGEFERV